MADLFKTHLKGQPRPIRSRRNAMAQEAIEVLKQKVAVTSKTTMPFIFDQPTATGEDTQRKIVLAATTVFSRIEYMTSLAFTEHWDLHFNECVNELQVANQYCIIYNLDLIHKEM